MYLTRYISTICVVFLVFQLGFMSAMAASVGVKAGDWAKYTMFGYQQDIMATKISILSVSGTTVSGKIEYEYSGGSIDFASFQGDVSRGETFPYVIPANLNEGDYIYYSDSYSNLKVENVTTRSYAGAIRTVVSTTQYGEQTFYWDQQTGILVEQTLGTGTVMNYLKLTETNLWGGGIFDTLFDTSNPFFWVLIVIIVVLAVALALVVLSSLRKKKPITETVTPPSPPEEKSTKTKYCPKCGTSMPLDSIYCPKCAHKQP